VHLHVLAGGDVAPAAGVRVGEVAHHLELVGRERPVGHLDADHLVVAALALPVDAVVQAEHAEDVLVELAGEVLPEHHLELGDVRSLLGVDLTLHHRGASRSSSVELQGTWRDNRPNSSGIPPR
jgi:hypothetical protein